MADREKPTLKELWRETPHKPGVYIMKDARGNTIYVGKAKDLHRRLGNYFSPTGTTLSNHKTRALINAIASFDYFETRNDQEAFLLESKLIKQYRPHYNIQMKDDKRYPLLKIPKGEKLPRFQLARVRKDDGARYFGPFVHSQALYATQEWLNRHFRLRTCKTKNPGIHDFRHCHADVIRNCSAPCIGRISINDYNRNFDQAVRLLEGTGRKSTLDELTREMMEAADELDFERAAYLRDIRDNLVKVLEPARRFRKGTPDLPGTVHPEEDMKELGVALGLESPPTIMECFDISNVSSNHIVASMVRFTNGRPDNKAYRRYRIRTVDGQNDFASMSEVIRRRYSRILAESDAVASRQADMTLYQWLKKLSAEGKAPIKVPDLVVVDGGKGQLSSALADLEAIGLGDMPIVGLAKQREEIFFPHQSQPLCLPHSTGALKLMQRIRDEAHRFANGYNELLYRKRMRESALDDAPGMSASKKRLLLEKFKSVTAIKKADPASIAAIRGISETWARTLLNYLNSSSNS
ncbi:MULTISPECIES: excinuclease ABC subunit UvrC [Akkermansia]|uniref:excinuclease ABC subunit UvrC n=1 Tax=Akkermansia TaxID=239934 RepID=UPI000AEC0B60|nr:MULTISPECIES: excinuclease ABC subunit UvrC [Akkermansia]MDR3815592.1 excinuclease ABC subunit UvrC [Akkermansia sp.]WMB16569.1 excinuclease ABC subunit UvrC [Akkermansia muciniphila]WMB21203.1 excinuclease ABC subunit UvrC [Akkermansia muciniphila]